MEGCSLTAAAEARLAGLTTGEAGQGAWAAVRRFSLDVTKRAWLLAGSSLRVQVTAFSSQFDAYIWVGTCLTLVHVWLLRPVQLTPAAGHSPCWPVGPCRPSLRAPAHSCPGARLRGGFAALHRL